MTSLARKSLFVLAAMVGVVVVGAGIFLLTFDADQYRGYILERLSQTLGRPVEAADVDLGLFPLSLTLNEIRVAESADFNGEYLLSAQAVEIHVTLSSLLSGVPVVTEFQLEQPTVYLRQDASGHWNISKLGRPTSSQSEAQVSQIPEGSPSGAPVRNWVLKDGTLVLERTGAEPLRLAGINLSFSDLSTTRPFPFQVSAALEKDTRLQIEGLIGPLNLDSLVDTPFSADGKMEANLETLRTVLGEWVPEIIPLTGQMRAEVKIEHSQETPLGLSGKIHLSDATLQPSGWTRPFSIQQADLEFGPNQVELQNLQVSIAGGTLQGFLRVKDWDAPKVVFEFSGEHFDVSELQNSIGHSQEPAGREAREAGPGETWFSKLTGQGQLKLGQLKHGTLILEPFEAAVQIAGSQVICEPISFGLHGGTGSGRLQIDLSRSEPSSTFSVQLEKVDANQMLSANTESKDRLFGNLQASLELTAIGVERNRIFQTATGQGAIQLTEGRLGVVNLGEELAALNSLVGLTFTETSTTLEELSFTFSVADGWIRTEDLLIRTPELAMSAVGRLSFTSELDFEATAAFTPEASQQLSSPLAGLFGSIFTDQYNRIVIPYDIKGNFKQPQFKLDAGRLAMMRLGVFLAKPPEPPQEETTPE